MWALQHLAVVPLLLAGVQASVCPSCYTQTVPGMLSCPLVPAFEGPCDPPNCTVDVTSSVPGPNPECPTTPTVTTYGTCPTTATCRSECVTNTATVTNPPIACKRSAAPAGGYGRRSYTSPSVSCYTSTVPAILHCPMIPAPTKACFEPQCIRVDTTTTTIAGPNTACPTTPTVTASGTCPTTATCRVGCETVIETVTATS